MADDSVLLSVEKIFPSFGGTQALTDVRFNVQQGEILAIIGPNGTGKTSLLTCVSNFYQVDRGQIFFDKQNITRLSPHKIAHLGIARTFQSPALRNRSLHIKNRVTSILSMPCLAHMTEN